MITEAEYTAAIEARKQAQDTIDSYQTQQRDSFKERMEINPVFTDDELVYAAYARCPCGHGVAYPKGCGMHHYWDCSAVLKGISAPGVKHGQRLPFAFYEIKSEGQPSAYGNTTRGTITPQAPKLTGDISVGLTPTCQA